MGRSMLVGDVHGCLTELVELVNLFGPKPDDTIVFVGDLLDRGPDSVGVVRFARGLARVCEVVLVQGNHEHKHERFRGHLKARPAVAADMAKRASYLETMSAEWNADDLAFLATARLWHRLDGDRGLVVHAGVLPKTKTLPATNDFALMDARTKTDAKALLMVRHVDARGNMVTLGQESPESRYWTSVYDGRFGTVYYGHQPYMQDAPQEHNGTVGLDLGCCFGGWLCAAVLDGLDVSYVKVRAKEVYSQRWGTEDEA